MRFSRTLTNQLGFTLTDTMMIAGLILFMISAFASYRFQQEKAAKAQETRNIYAQLRNNLKSGASQSQALSKTEELDYTEIK